MRALPVFLFGGLVLSAFSCKPESKTVAAIPTDTTKSLVIGNPLDCGIEGMQIFPVGCNYKPRVYEKELEVARTSRVLSFTANSSAGNYDRTAKTEYINTNENEFDIRNIVFYDLEAGNSYPLMSDTAHILSFALHKEFENKLIFYRVVKNDINKDSVYNASDPVMLFVSDLNGRNLTQVTPENEQFVDYFYYEKTQTILVKTVIDGNKDGSFTAGDETNFREMKIKTPTIGREIFTKSLKDSLRLM